jgi:adenylate cyclase
VISSLWRLPRSSIPIAGLVAVLVAVAVMGARSLGLLEALELVAYDAFTQLRYSDPVPDARIALVTVTEHDVLANGWPLSDDVLARAIEAVARDEARAIGLDIYRDVSVKPGTQKLEAVLATERRVIAVMKHAGEGSSGVRPPSVLRDCEALDSGPPRACGTERVGFSDILVDPGGVVRRGLLFLDDGAAISYSFPLRLALLYLQAYGVVPQADPRDPSYLRLGRVTIPPLEPDDGGYVRADARGYQFLLDFKRAGRPFPSIDLASLLAGSFEPGVFRDRIVLIGVVAESVGDSFYTPFSRGLKGRQSVPGVVIHAHIASQLLRIGLDGEAPIAVLPQWQEWLWVLLWSIAGALVGLRVQSAWRLPLPAGAGLVGLGAFDLLAFLAGRWIPLIPPALGWLLAAGIVTAYMSYRVTVERALLMQLFSRHVSREVAEAIWRQRDQFLDGGRPRPERLVVTVLFADLQGFTTVAEKHTPEALLEWLNEYVGAMTQEVSRYGGVVRQYAGDAIVAMFGIPVPRQTQSEIDQDARNAVQCALAMETALRELNRRWRLQGRPTAGMRIGIFTGAVVSGTLGNVERSEYVVVGDTVNTASRLESYDKELFAPDADARPSRILIGEPTLVRLDGRFETERVGDVTLKGKENRISVYRVIGRSQEPGAATGETLAASLEPVEAATQDHVAAQAPAQASESEFRSEREVGHDAG